VGRVLRPAATALAVAQHELPPCSSDAPQVMPAEGWLTETDRTGVF